MVTAELAAVLPVLVIVLGVALSAVAVVGARVRVADAAREAVRAAARGDYPAARSLAAEAAPGASVRITRSGDDVVAEVTQEVHLLGDVVPQVTVAERAVALDETTDDETSAPSGAEVADPSSPHTRRGRCCVRPARSP